MYKTPAKILNDAADLLATPGKWGTGAFFTNDGITGPQINDETCRMCAHGAIAYCSDNEVKNILNSPTKNHSTKIEKIAKLVEQDEEIFYLYDLNESSVMVKKLTPEKRIQHKAHRIAREVGLTMDFNDLKAKTVNAVIKKLRKAAKLAENIGD